MSRYLSEARFLFCFVAPVAGWLALSQGGWMSYLPVAIVFGFHPLMDVLLPRARSDIRMPRPGELNSPHANGHDRDFPNVILLFIRSRLFSRLRSGSAPAVSASPRRTS
jgi:hypothetical protein